MGITGLQVTGGRPVKESSRGLKSRYFASLAGLFFIFLTGSPLSLLHAAKPASISISVPAHLYLAELNKRQILPRLRARIRNSGWRVVDALDPSSGCHFSIQGELTAANIPYKGSVNREEVEMCELTLFTPEIRLASGWEMVRIHWGGETRSVKWFSNPTHTYKPYLHIELLAPDSGRRSVFMRLVTLRGPAGSSWEQSFN